MTLTLNVSSWTQDQKNMTKAMCVLILHKNSITYDGITISMPSISVDGPSADISTILTQENIELEYAAWKTANDAATAADIAEMASRKAELADNAVSKYKLDQVDAAIDSLSNLAELKTFLRKLVRYIIATKRI